MEHSQAEVRCRLHRKGSACGIVLVLALALGWGFGGAAMVADEKGQLRFNHARTGFSLTGGHARAECGSCHLRGVFRGTPRQCMLCHTRGGRIDATPKPGNHIPTTSDCGNCHRTTAWFPATYNHLGTTQGGCALCHNRVSATGKPSNHILTAATCDSCHRTRVWVPAVFSHAMVPPGTCATCHNGISAVGKPNGHVVTAQSCDVCHRTNAWIPVK